MKTNLFSKFGLGSTSNVIKWCNYYWNVKSGGPMGPGSNYWKSDNVWVDANGDLHMRISKKGGRWYCSEIWTQDRLPFGKYQFWVIGWLDKLDKNVVLGLFNYPTSDVGPDGTNEIDIEMSKWGSENNQIGNYTVWPSITGVGRWYCVFSFTLTGTYTTHRFIWQENSVNFQSLYGHSDWNDSGNEIVSITTPSSYAGYIPQNAMSVHINLWLNNGRPPSNGLPVEIVIRQFTYSSY